MSQLSKISNTENLDVVCTVRGEPKYNATGKAIGGFKVEASITKFKSASEGQGASVLKKVSVFAEDSSIDAAQDKALEKAVVLLGL